MNVLKNPKDIARAVEKLAASILERDDDLPLAVIGIHSGGVPLAQRLFALISKERADAELGQLDVMLYRDDGGGLVLREAGSIGSAMDFDVADRRIILVDDVLYTGRTIRAALDQLMDFGRPAKVELAVLVDRGHRQLPIQADYVGFTITTAPKDRIRVEFAELGHDDAVLLKSADETPSKILTTRPALKETRSTKLLREIRGYGADRS